MLTYRGIKKNEMNYAIQLARDEINIELKRLDQYKTYLIYNNKEKIGFISFGFQPDRTIYIYILAFERHAQRQGFGSLVIDSVMKYGQEKVEQFRGISITINKLNVPAIKAANKYGFILNKERKKYFDFIKPVS